MNQDPVNPQQNMADQMALCMGNTNQVSQNQNTFATPITEQQVHVDTPGPSQQRPSVPPLIPPSDQYPVEDIREEVQRRVHLAREREVQRQAELILERDRLVPKERDRLDEEATRAG
ncbi:hypothetical protein LIER_31680 [Lithospermum erythrorhizon]|uniref:Uncharacterized protein n=1 Tax=Lithospermum erythrorhizon TaxID=34254 RepID=A0AAV3RVH4_LITER